MSGNGQHAASEQAGARDDRAPGERAVLSIDTAALQANYRWLASHAAPAHCAGVVKADAYGLGLVNVVPALLGAGCTTFFVAALSEAERLAGLAPRATIYVLDGLLAGAAPRFAALREQGADVRPALGSRAEIEEWVRALGPRGAPAGVHVDTGMNRLGLPPAEVAALAASPELLHQLDIQLVLSHLASGEEIENPKTEAQRQLFDALRAQLPPAPASLGNSAGTQLAGAYRYDLVRPGIALYGGHVIETGPNPMRPVVRLEARILQVREVPAGETIGYNETYRVARPSRIATVAAGYADGILRALSTTNDEPGLTARIGGHAAPWVGRVSMDLITLDVTDVPAAAACRGAFAELLGSHTTIDDMARRARTNCYEVLTRLGPRLARRTL